MTVNLRPIPATRKYLVIWWTTIVTNRSMR